MNKKRLICTALLAALTLIVAGCTGGTVPPDTAPVPDTGSGKGQSSDGPADTPADSGEQTVPQTEAVMDEKTAQALLARKYTGPFSEGNGALAATDGLGRALPEDTEVPDGAEREVGLFYFLWQGQHGMRNILDNSVIEKVPGATLSEEAWMAAGGGVIGENHFWGKPIFDYYTSDDTWVMRKQVQMFCDAGVDYLVVDTTNAYTYSPQALKLFAVLREYADAGMKVPKVAFYTNTDSGKTMTSIYLEIYKPHPEYSDLWYRWEDKPMIVGIDEDPGLSDEARSFFRIKRSQWPTQSKYDDGFPWMEFSRLLSDEAVYGTDGRRELLNISVAQHSETVTMSATAFYGANDRTRSWHDGSNDRSPDAVLYGYNFAEQWEWALKQGVKNIFVTGWNEWTAQRQPGTGPWPVVFIDCCDPNTSRDIEPMDGLFGDNYYMQLIDGIRRFKGTERRVDAGGYATVDMSDADAAVSAFDNCPSVYSDFLSDCVDRNAKGFGFRNMLTNSTGLNDISGTSVLRDRDRLYFLVSVAGNEVLEKDENRMTLLINVRDGNTELYGGAGTGEGSVSGFGFAVNRAAAGDDGFLSVERAKEDGSGWESAGRAAYVKSGRNMVVAVPRELLGIKGAPDGEHDLVSLSFKWTDGCDTSDVFSFYRDGDAAPYGRMAYLYSNVK